MSDFTTDLEADLANIARIGAVPLPNADGPWMIACMESFEAWCRSEFGNEGIRPNDLAMLAQNLHIYLLELLATSVPQLRFEILESAVLGFEASMRRRKSFQ